MGGGYREEGDKEEKKWGHCNSIINKIYFKKVNTFTFFFLCL